MSATTITINASTNPTYGGKITQTGGTFYDRRNLDTNDPTAQFDGVVGISRVFSFFDLSTDPTSGGTITKVELLATVSSVGGTHAVGVFGRVASFADAAPGVDPSIPSDEDLYIQCGGDGDPALATLTPSTGALVSDLGADAITSVGAGISAINGFFAGIALSNEAAAGSVVFDAAVGFRLRITFTPAGPSAPTVPATNVVISNIRPNSFDWSYTPGNGAKRLVFAAQVGIAENLAGSVVDDHTYVANQQLGLGDTIDDDGVVWNCVSNGTATSGTVIGAIADLLYLVAVIECNGNPGSEKYNDDTATGNPTGTPLQTISLPASLTLMTDDGVIRQKRASGSCGPSPVISSAGATEGQTGLLVAFDADALIDLGPLDTSRWSLLLDDVVIDIESIDFDGINTYLVTAAEAFEAAGTYTIQFFGGDPSAARYLPNCVLGPSGPVTIDVA